MIARVAKRAVGGAVALAAMWGLATPALSQPALDGNQVVTSLNQTQFEAIVAASAANGTFEREVGRDGIERLSFEYESGRKALAELKACNDAQQCFGISIYAGYEIVTPDADARRIFANNFNGELSIGKLVAFDDGSVILERYVITDGGVTINHLLQEFVIFHDAVMITYEQKLEQATSGS